MREIVGTSLSDRAPLEDIALVAREGKLDVLVAFGRACRRELEAMT
jgi:hypothetical protein